jgi:uncharacterized protein YkwD
MARRDLGTALALVGFAIAVCGVAGAETPRPETSQVPVRPITGRDIEQLPITPNPASSKLPTVPGAAPSSDHPSVGRRQLSALEAGVLAELNAARSDPRAYADGLRRYEAYYHGKLVNEPGHPVAMTIEGAAAVDDAIAYLTGRSPVPPLVWSDPLAGAATRLVVDLGPKGGLGHIGSDGSTMTQRIQAAGVWAAAKEEDITLVPRTAEAVVRQLVIDDGVVTRGHRTAIFDPSLSVAGVGCGPHAAYGWMCVIDFAGALMAGPGAEAGPLATAPLPATNPFGPPRPGATVHADGSWTMTFNDGAETTYLMDGSMRTVFPKPGEGPPPPPNAPPPGPPAPPPPPIADEAMFTVLDAYVRDHPVEGATSTQHSVSTEGGKARSGTVSYFSHGAEIYRARFDAQGNVVFAGKTAEGRALDTMKRFKFAYFSGEHGVTAASIGKTPGGDDYVRHASFTDEDGRYRGFMDFDQDGALTRGVVYKANGDVEAKWAGPPEPASGAVPPPKLQNLDELNADLDREDAEQKAASLKAWREEYPPAPPQVSP